MISTRMRNMLYLAALILVLAVNAIVLLRVHNNRTGTPESLVELTERELRPSYSHFNENSGLAMVIVWRTYNQNDTGYYWSSSSSPDWFDAAKLRRLGFQVPAGEKKVDYRRYRPRPLPKRVFIVLEMNSPLHDQLVARLEKKVAEIRNKLLQDPAGKELQATLKNAEDNLQKEKTGRSRLFAVDADLDPDVLRTTYPDRSRYIIARAIVRMQSSYSKDKSTHYRGWIEQLGVAGINVPKKLRDRLSFLKNSATSYRMYDKPPRYKATIGYGSSFEPWLVSVSALQAAQKSIRTVKSTLLCADHRQILPYFRQLQGDQQHEI